MERGWHGKLAQLQATGAALLARAGLQAEALPPGALALVQHAMLCTLPMLALLAFTERLQRGSSARTALQR